MCYEYDWMQVPQADEELRRAQEKADPMKEKADPMKTQGGAPPPAEPAPVAEPATA